MYAYKEIYLPDAREHLAEMFDYAINAYGMDSDEFWTLFVNSSLSKGLCCGEVRLLAGMSGYELFAALIYECMQKRISLEPIYAMDRSVEYWAGWALAYYQWSSGISYKSIYDSGIKLSDITDMYILHEAPDEKFVEIMNEKVRGSHEEKMLKRLRRYCGLTQKELSEVSGVSLRMIQLYEQGQNDIAKAQAKVVQSLADALGTDVKELVT